MLQEELEKLVSDLEKSDTAAQFPITGNLIVVFTGKPDQHAVSSIIRSAARLLKPHSKRTEPD